MVRKYRSIEGARGVAALGVVTYHVGQLNANPGWLAASTSRLWLGVPLFFLLSGFLLFRPFAAAIVRREPLPSLRRYGRSRILRIAPAFWIALTVEIAWRSEVLAGTAPFGLALFLCLRAFVVRSRISLLIAGAASLVGISALVIAGTNLWPAVFANYFLYYTPLGPYGVLGPAWTLCIEVSFYLLLPVLAGGAYLLARGGATPAHRAARLAACVSLALPVGIAYVSIIHPPFSHLWLAAFIDQFAVGMLLAVALTVRPKASVRTSRLLLATGIGVGVIANLFSRVGAPSPSGNGTGVWFAPLMVVAFALVLASVLLRGESTALGRVLGSRTLFAAGTISYGIYLWHFPIIEYLGGTAWWRGASEAVALLVVAALTLVFATASWFAVERFALAAKDKHPSSEHEPRAGTG